MGDDPEMKAALHVIAAIHARLSATRSVGPCVQSPPSPESPHM